MGFVLLPHQEKFLQSLDAKIRNNFYTIVTGPSGCGKSFAFKAFENNFKESLSSRVIIFDSDYVNEERDYSAFRKSMTNVKLFKEYVKEGTVEVAKDTPFVGNIVSYLISSVIKPKPNATLQFLNEDELTILNYIKKAMKARKLYVICDNIHWWDRRSLLLLIQFISQSNIFVEQERKQIRFILSITDNQYSLNADILNELQSSTNKDCKLLFPTFDYPDFKKKLFLESHIRLQEEQVELLYSLVNGHLKVYFEIIQEISENSFDFDSSYENNKKYLDTMLDRRLKECGASGEQITKVLEYASIIGLSFSSYELEVITDSTKSKIRKIIKEANDLRLTQNDDKIEHYKFAHDIIREVFMSKVNLYHIEYYETLSSCLKQIKPGQYLRRARYMAKALRYEDAAILYLLEFIYQLRTYGDIMITLSEEAIDLFNNTQIEYWKQMKLAYTSYNMKNYNATLKYLELILGYYPMELLAERDILKLRCYSKKLATEETISAIHELDKKRAKEKFNGEIEVWERYNHALITAYAHLGEIEKARLLEEELLNSLSARLTYDDIANHRINIIKRNSNAIHGIDVAPFFIKQSVSYFSGKDGNNNYKNLKDYYTSLINYSAILIKQGEFLEAYNHTLIAFQLEKDNPHFRFQRTQILKSNFIVSSILTNRINVSEGITLYEDILKNLAKGMAERLFYASNLSILYAIDNKIKTAYKVLNKEVQNHNIDDDQEGLYKYRFLTNCAIYQYLLGDASTALQNLELLNGRLSRLINGSFFQKKNELLISIMKQDVICNGSDWLSIVHQRCPSYQGKPWRYFGLGYAFAALCDWGI